MYPPHSQFYGGPEEQLDAGFVVLIVAALLILAVSTLYVVWAIKMPDQKQGGNPAAPISHVPTGPGEFSFLNKLIETRI